MGGQALLCGMAELARLAFYGGVRWRTSGLDPFRNSAAQRLG